MKYLIFLLLLTFVSCQDSNSNSADRIIYSDLIEDPLDPNFGPAFQVVTKRCISCHTSNYHDAWANLLTSQAWKDAGTVKAGSPDTSVLITRMKNFNANETMPQDGGAIPDSEYQLLRKWIQEM